MAVETFSKSGTKASTPAKLDKSVFGLKVENHQLLKEAYLAYMANSRLNLARTKRRGEVRGGGAKPWRQKGTGRARVGSIRSPIWTGGGVTFGPTGNENYAQRLNTQAKRLALRQALSLAADNDRIKVAESFSFPDGKVKSALIFLSKIKANGNIVLVAEHKDPMIERATKNLQNVKLIQAKYLSTFNVLNADTIIISRKSLDIISDWLLSKSTKTPAKTTKEALDG